jgi:hypothetical protein
MYHLNIRMISMRVVGIYGGGGHSSRINQHQQDHLLKKTHTYAFRKRKKKKKKEVHTVVTKKRKRETKNKQEG